MSDLALYTNSAGDSCVRNWSEDDLMAGFRTAEETGDDLLYLAVMGEVERRKLTIVDNHHDTHSKRRHRNPN